MGGISAEEIVAYHGILQREDNGMNKGIKNE